MREDMKSKWGIDAVILWTIQNKEVLEKRCTTTCASYL